MQSEKVSVIVPILNEEKYIEKFLNSILEQDYPKENLEIILVDGMSTDKTREIIKSYAEKFSFMKLVDNEKKTVQYALNLGIENSSGEYIVRMDAHAWYAKDYVSKCIEYLKKTNAENVGGPTIVKGKTRVQNVIAAAYSCPFALGGSSHYKSDFEGYADTVSWGSFRRDYLVSIGMYDESMPRSEDDDLNFRIAKSGGKIFITPKIKSEYYPKETFSKLFKQYFEYGVWKIALIKKHGKPPRITQFIPMVFVLFLVGFGLLSFFSKMFAQLWILGVSLYTVLNFYFSFKSEALEKTSDKLLLMWANFVMHVSYGTGFIAGIFKFWNNNWRKHEN